MSASNSKLIAGILAGAVLGIGGSVAYVKLHEHPQPPTQAVASAPPNTQAEQPATLPDADLSNPPSQSAPPAPPAVQPAARTAKPKHSVAPKQIAQNDYQPPVLNTPAPDAAPSSPNPYTAPPPSAAASDNPPRPAVQEPDAAAPQPAAAAPAPPPAPPKPRSVTLDSGTKLVIRTIQALSTKDMQSGDSFRATLDAPLVRDGAIIAEKGSSVSGVIVLAQRAGHVDRHSDLQLQLKEINTTDGQRIHVTTSIVDQQGQGDTRGNAEKVGGGAALGAIIGAIAGGGKGAAIGAGAGSAAGAGGVFATRGKDVVLPSETRLTFQLSQPVTITEQLH